MAVHTIESPLHITETPAEPLVDPSRTVSGVGPQGTPEINLGAFRRLAFALIFETVLVLLGGVAWQIFRLLR
jgi:hypothetical protein